MSEEVNLTSDRDLQREFDSIAHTLENTTNDWKQRMNALKRIQAIV
jgi:hypothetical protein